MSTWLISNISLDSEVIEGSIEAMYGSAHIMVANQLPKIVCILPDSEVMVNMEDGQLKVDTLEVFADLVEEESEAEPLTQEPAEDGITETFRLPDGSHLEVPVTIRDHPEKDGTLQSSEGSCLTERK